MTCLKPLAPAEPGTRGVMGQSCVHVRLVNRGRSNVGTEFATSVTSDWPLRRAVAMWTRLSSKSAESADCACPAECSAIASAESSVTRTLGGRPVGMPTPRGPWPAALSSVSHEQKSSSSHWQWASSGVGALGDGEAEPSEERAPSGCVLPPSKPRASRSSIVAAALASLSHAKGAAAAVLTSAVAYCRSSCSSVSPAHASASVRRASALSRGTTEPQSAQASASVCVPKASHLASAEAGAPYPSTAMRSCLNSSDARSHKLSSAESAPWRFDAADVLGEAESAVKSPSSRRIQSSANSLEAPAGKVETEAVPSVETTAQNAPYGSRAAACKFLLLHRRGRFEPEQEEGSSRLHCTPSTTSTSSFTAGQPTTSADAMASWTPVWPFIRMLSVRVTAAKGAAGSVSEKSTTSRISSASASGRATRQSAPESLCTNSCAPSPLTESVALRLVRAGNGSSPAQLHEPMHSPLRAATSGVQRHN
eukprot:4605313-Pleurochrysis_carterae.AAC.2